MPDTHTMLNQETLILYEDVGIWFLPVLTKDYLMTLEWLGHKINVKRKVQGKLETKPSSYLTFCFSLYFFVPKTVKYELPIKLDPNEIKTLVWL